MGRCITDGNRRHDRVGCGGEDFDCVIPHHGDIHLCSIRRYDDVIGIPTDRDCAHRRRSSRLGRCCGRCGAICRTERGSARTGVGHVTDRNHHTHFAGVYDAVAAPHAIGALVARIACGAARIRRPLGIAHLAGTDQSITAGVTLQRHSGATGGTVRAAAASRRSTGLAVRSAVVALFSALLGAVAAHCRHRGGRRRPHDARPTDACLPGRALPVTIALDSPGSCIAVPLGIERPITGVCLCKWPQAACGLSRRIKTGPMRRRSLHEGVIAAVRIGTLCHAGGAATVATRRVPVFAPLAGLPHAVAASGCHTVFGHGLQHVGLLKRAITDLNGKDTLPLCLACYAVRRRRCGNLDCFRCLGGQWIVSTGNVIRIAAIATVRQIGCEVEHQGRRTRLWNDSITGCQGKVLLLGCLVRKTDRDCIGPVGIGDGGDPRDGHAILRWRDEREGGEGGEGGGERLHRNTLVVFAPEHAADRRATIPPATGGINIGATAIHMRDLVIATRCAVQAGIADVAADHVIGNTLIDGAEIPSLADAICDTIATVLTIGTRTISAPQPLERDIGTARRAVRAG